MEWRPFSPEYLLEVLPGLLPFLGVTLTVTVGTIVFGSLLGGLLAWAGKSRSRLLAVLSRGYIYIIRCTPSIVLLFIVFYGLPKFCLEVLETDINAYDKIFFVLVSFTLLFAAPISEVMRSAWEAIDRGQYEAAVSIGLSPGQAFFHIVLPQAAVVALPNFGNAVINLMKEGALAYTIGLVDMIGKGQLMISHNYGAYALETYLALAAIYLVLTVGVEKLCRYLERSFSPPRSAA